MTKKCFYKNIGFLFLSLIFIGCEDNLKENTEEGFTITHAADDSEEVFISYENTKKQIAATNYEMQPGQCLKFTKNQFKFITSIRVGAGLLEQHNSLAGIKTVCGQSKAAGEGFLSESQVSPCSYLAGSHHQIKNRGALGTDKYVLEKTVRNSSQQCKYFENILIGSS